MKKKLFAAAGLILCLLAGCGKKEPANYDLGVASLAQQEYAGAIEYFQKAVTQEEKPVKAWRGIGIVKAEQGIFDEAEAAFSKALEFTEKKDKAMRADLYLYLADALYHQKKYEECIQNCEEYLTIRKDSDGYFLRGSAYLHLKEYSKAGKDFNKITAKSEKYEDYLNIYRVYSECDLNADGGNYLEEALEFPAKKAEDYYNRGRIYYYLAEYKDAERELKMAVKKKDARASIYLGKVYVASGDLKKAKETYESSLNQEETEAEAYNGLAYCAILEEDYTKALEYIKEGLKTADADAKQALLFNEIVVYEKKSDFASAKHRISAYLEQYPGDEEAVREDYFLQTR